MKLIVAPDSFKGSISARGAAEAMRTGILHARPQAEVAVLPVADGGEGTLDALCPDGQRRQTVTGPAGRPVSARFGFTGNTAIIEMAEAAGLGLLPSGFDPLDATTTGVGELITAALDAGAEKLLLTVGGSGTNDAGIGLAHALGVRFYEAAGAVLPPVARSLFSVCTVDAGGLDPRLRRCDITLACDVDNPLCGPRGATFVYGPQKGVTQVLAPSLDVAMARATGAMEAAAGRPVADRPGCGAGGGIAAPLLAFTEAKLVPGIEAVLAACGFDTALAGAAMVLSGEGKLDHQSLSGKAVAGIARHAARAGVPLAVIFGVCTLSEAELREAGIACVHTLVRPGTASAAAMAAPAPLIADRAAELAKSL